jgi:hypothetical protein
MKATGYITSLCLILIASTTSLACKAGPAFNVSNLEIRPAEVVAGDAVQISLVVRNGGGVQGTDVINIQIDGVTKKTQEVNLAPGQTKSIAFSTIENEGIHNVNVAGTTGTFSVRKLNPLTIVTESIPLIKLRTLVPLTKSSTVSENFTLTASGGLAPYSWSWKFPVEITDPNPGLFNIAIIYKPITPSGEGIAQVAIPLTAQGTISGGLIMALDANKQFIVPVFYPEKIVKVPVTVTVRDSKGNVASKDFHLELTMSD